MKSLLKMNPKYNYPACNSEDVIEFEEYIHCPRCNLEFFKEPLDKDIDKEDILSEEELQGITDAFYDEFADEKDRKKLLKSLEKDFL